MSWRGVAVALTVMAAAALAGAAPERDVLAHFSGSDDAVTRSFTVDRPFDVRWRAAEAVDFRILLQGMPSGIPSIVADPAIAAKPGVEHEGTASFYRPGRYHFEVRGAGPWSIEVVPALKEGAAAD